MSYAIDANVLLYASDSSSPHFRRAAAFLKRCAAGAEVLCLAWPTIMAYLRISTHPAIFSSPLTPVQAMKNVDGLLSLPHARVLSEEEGFWAVFRDAASAMAVRGNLVPDAHLACLLRQHGVATIYTNDTDLRKFAFLDVRNPLEGDA